MLSKTPKIMPYKYLLFIAMFFVSIDLAAVAVAYKLISFNFIFSINSGATFIFPITYALGDIVTEVYGYSMARKLIWFTLLLQLIFAILITVTIHLPGPSFWNGKEAFDFVFGSVLRFVLAGTLAVTISSFLNIYIVSKLKIPLEGKLFWLRSVFSIIIGCLILSFIVVIIGFGGLKFNGQSLNIYKTWVMLRSTYALEILYAFLLAGPASIAAKFLKHKEEMDVYDHGINFNPFCINDERNYEINI